MKKVWNKWIAMMLCVTLLLSLSGCSGTDWIFFLNGEELYEKDVAAFGYIYALEYNIREQEQLDAIYENGMLYEEYCKEQLEEDIISTVLLYKAAKEHKVKLSEGADNQIAVNTEKVLERFGEEALEASEVSVKDIEKVYEMKMLGETYMNELSGEEQVETEEKSASSEGESAAAERYVKVYQVTFATALLDDEGMVQSDEEGRIVRVSAGEIAKQKENATSFAEAMAQGENVEELLTGESGSAVGIEKYLKYADLEKDYRLAIDGMSEGEVSEVLESDYGFVVLKLLEKEDMEYAETMGKHEAETSELAVREELLAELYSLYADANMEYKNVEKWREIRFADYIK